MQQFTTSTAHRPTYSLVRHFILAVITGAFLSSAGTANAQQGNLSRDCNSVLAKVRTEFRDAADEIDYFNFYLSCWGQAVVTNGKAPPRSYLNKGLKLFSDSTFVEASAFSKGLCDAAVVYRIYGEYPCWFERETTTQNVSLDEAARREAPKILFSDLLKARDGSDKVQLVLCTNDDPTKPKEYSRGCKRGYRAEITEYGRGDFNADNVEDIVVNIKFGSNSESARKCYMAAFTRLDNDYFRMIRFSDSGLCER